MSSRNSTWYVFCRWLVKVLYIGTHGGLRSINEENLPRTGAVIVAPLHISHLDPPAVGCGTRRQLQFMSKGELFKVPILGPLLRSLGAFPVRRGEGDTEAVRKSMQLLEQGAALLIFPEGTRGDGITMGPVNRGIAMLAKRTGALVLPVGVVGTDIVMPRDKGKRRRHLMTVIYGKPFSYEDVGKGANEKETRELFAKHLAAEIVRLSREHGSTISLPE